MQELSALRLQRIRARLEQSFAPLELTLEDQSHLHAGHAGARSGKGHFKLSIVAGAFAGLPALERHRRIHAALGEIMEEDIHALSIKAAAPAERPNA